MAGPVPEAAIRTGFAETRWCGRLANCSVAEACRCELTEPTIQPRPRSWPLNGRAWPGEQQGVCWILGIQAHKQAIAMLQSLIKPPDQAWIVPVPGHSSWDRATLAEQEESRGEQMHQRRAAAQPLWRQFAHGDHERSDTILAGSLYLIGDLFRRCLVTAE